MRQSPLNSARGTALFVALLATALGACRPKPPESPPAPVPTPPEVGASTVPPVAQAEQAPAESSAQAGLPGQAAPVAATQAATATATPSATAAAHQPDIEEMSFAQPESSKIGVPVDLRFEVEGDGADGRPVTVHLAAVPRTAGDNLKVSVKEEPLLKATGAPLTAQKATTSTAYRQSFSVTRLPGAPEKMSVLVSMELGNSLAFSFFNVPLTAAAVAGKPVVQELH